MINSEVRDKYASNLSRKIGSEECFAFFFASYTDGITGVGPASTSGNGDVDERSLPRI